MIHVLLPAYNEEKSLDKLFPKIKEVMEANNSDYKIIIMDDGSKDKTQKKIMDYKAQGYPIEMLVHKINRGLGETIRDIFEYAAGHSGDDDIFIRLDCDDTHEPKYMPDIINKINEGYDVVITSRFQPGGGVDGLSAYRSFISKCANLFMKFFFNIRGIKEYSCGYRGYRAKIIKDAIRIFGNSFIDLKGMGFTCTLEKFIKMRMMGAKITEVPFVLRYDQKMSESKMISSITTLGYIMLVLKYIYPWGRQGKTMRKVLEEYKKTQIQD